MTERGKIIFVGAVERGVAAKTGSAWASQEFVIETNERYPRKIAFTIFGEEKISNAAIREGEIIDVIFFPESHQWNSRWFTELRATDIIDNGRSRFVVPLI